MKWTCRDKGENWPSELEWAEYFTKEWAPKLLTEPHLVDIHFQLQSFQCACRLNYTADYAGKVEQFEQDFNYILYQMGIQEASNFTHIKSNQGGMRFTAEYYFNKLPQDLVHKIYDAYKLDYVTLGYPKPTFIND